MSRIRCYVCPVRDFCMVAINFDADAPPGALSLPSLSDQELDRCPLHIVLKAQAGKDYWSRQEENKEHKEGP